MTNIFDPLLSFFTDRSKRLSTRVSIFIFSIILLFIIDNVVGFSHYYKTDQQLRQIQTISTVLRDTSLPKETRKQLIELQKQTLERKNAIDYSLSFLKNISWTSSKQSQKTIKQSGKIIRNEFWFVISSCGIFIFLSIVMIPVSLIIDRKEPIFKVIATSFILSVSTFILGWFCYNFFSFILPDHILGSWTWNYIFNGILQIMLIVGLYQVGNKNK